jgi:diguanylate cyclase
MHYDQTPDAAAEILRMILPTLSRLDLPVNPINYALWYEYYLGRHDDLNAELEAVTSGTKPYSAKIAERLFANFVVMPGVDKFQNIGRDITRMLAELIRLVGELGVGAKDFRIVLEHCSGNLDEVDSLEQFRELVRQMVEETRSMLETNRRFQDQLAGTSSDIDMLRQELAEIRQQVSQDPLTGVANRRAFDETLAKTIEMAAMEERSICLMMLDIDRFKEINDRHGHLIGDKVIKYVATTLKRLVRGGDFVARYGGEEFGIILDDTPEKGAIIVAENVRATIEQAMLKRTDTGDPIGTVTVSIGISRYGKGDTGESLLDRADRALYHAKQEGRNRVSFTSR